MPFEIDEDAMKEKKTVDIDKIPVKQIPFMEFPKVLYLHPKDKSLEHRSKVVKDAEEQKAALAQGWREKPHIPVVEEAVEDGFEADIPAKRGRPAKPDATEEDSPDAA